MAAANAAPVIPIDAGYDPTTRANRSFIASVISRWPLLLIGVIGGVILGVLGWSQQPETFESTAKLLVLKKREQQFNANDFRNLMLEDYMSTQLAIIRSETILLQCARELKFDQFDPPLKEDELARYSDIAANLTVARDRDSGTPTTTGSSVLNLSFRGRNRRDTRIILEKVIAVYKREVQDRYNQDTKDLISELTVQIALLNKAKSTAESEDRRLLDHRVQICKEEPNMVSQRITQLTAQMHNFVIELKQVSKELELMAQTKDRKQRELLFLQLGGFKQRNLTNDPNSPENVLQALQNRLEELTGGGRGPDHSEVRLTESQIKYYKKLIAAQNPGNPTGEIDELGILQAQKQHKKEALESQIGELNNIIRIDSNTVTQVTPVNADIDMNRSRMLAVSKELNIKEDQKVQLERKIQQEGGYSIKELTNARDGHKVGPNLLFWLFGGAIVGILMGGGLAFMNEMSDKSFRSPAEIRERLGVPIYGHIPDLRKNLPPDIPSPPDVDSSLVATLRPKSVEAEAYRGVRAQLMVATQSRSHQVIQVTSPNPGDGKSTLAANLAVSLAQTGKRVILLDCDFRKPRIHKIFNLHKPEVGLASVTNGDTELNDAIRHGIIENLDLLPCGPRPANPAELLTGLNFQDVLTKLKAHYDYVIVDTPPLLAVSDPRVVAQRVDGVLLVFKITKRARPTAERAREQLADMGANVLGVVVNGAGGGAGEYGYGYNYKYTYSYDYEYAEEYVDNDNETRNA